MSLAKVKTEQGAEDRGAGAGANPARGGSAAQPSTSPANASSPSPPEIDADDLQKLSEKHAAKRRYPPGCPVWYELASSHPKCLDGCHGVVRNVYMDMESNGFVYSVGSDDDGSNASSPSSGRLLWEAQLTYAMNCPVKVTGPFTLDDEPGKEMEGVILCPKPGKGSRKLSYTVRLHSGANRFRVELGVEYERISFRKEVVAAKKAEEEVIVVDTKEEQVKDDGQKKEAPVSILVKESKIKNGGQPSPTQSESGEGSVQKRPAKADEICNEPSKSSAGIGGGTGANKEDTATDNARKVESSRRDTPKEDEITDRESEASSLRVPAVITTAPAPSPPKRASPASGSQHESNKRPRPSPPGEQRGGARQLHPASDERGGSTGRGSRRSLSPMAAVPSKAVYQKSTREKPTIRTDGGGAPVPGDDRRKSWEPSPSSSHDSRRRSAEVDGQKRKSWEPPPSSLSNDSQQRGADLGSPASASGDVTCRLKVPMWVVEARLGVFEHLIGVRAGDRVDRGYKTRHITSETNCRVNITPYHRPSGTPMLITIRPMRHWGDPVGVAKAREMIEDSLLEFVECGGSKARLQYELALSCEGASSLPRAEEGVVQLRDRKSNEVVWAKLLDLPKMEKDRVISFTEDAQLRSHHEHQCSVEVFGWEMLCKPFALIRGKCSEAVCGATKLVAGIIRDYSTPLQSPTAAAANGSCRLTVPLWVKDCKANKKSLFYHIVGIQNGQKNMGYKTDEIEAETGCRVDVSRCDKAGTQPIYITMLPTRKDANMARARKMIEDSVLEFIDCDGAKARLRYELAASSQGESNLLRSEEGFVQLIDLPSMGDSLLAFFLDVRDRVKSATVEVYDQSLNLQLSANLCKPFALIRGKTSEAVSEATKVVSELMELQKSAGNGPPQGGYCRLTLPLWVTDSTARSVANHVVGVQDTGERGYKARKIERETACSVYVSCIDRINNIPLYITILPSSRDKSDITQATDMVVMDLLDFMGCEGSKARLQYDLALSVQGTSNLLRTESGIVQQRNWKTSPINKEWTNLLDLPTLDKNNLLPFANAKQRLQREFQCSVEVFHRGLGNLKLRVELCKPFVLVRGKTSDAVCEATKAVSGIMNECNELQEGRVTLGKRKSQPDDSSTISSREQSIKVSKSYEEKEESSMGNKSSSVASCILTVPQWVTRNRQREALFVHLVGKELRPQGYTLGHKTKEITSRTGCRVSIGRNETPMTIRIRSSNETSTPFKDVRLAKRMIVKSLVEFLDDGPSEARLIFELAMTAEGTFTFRKAGNAVQQECQLTHVSVWMELLELPSTEWGDGKQRPHCGYLLHENAQRYLKGNTSCQVEVYGFGDVPKLCGPYVLVCGDNPDEVNEVAARVSGKIKKHMEVCQHGCQFLSP